jgi:hypothetical protein
LGRGLALGVQGGGSTPARGWGESPILGTELGAEGAGAKLRHTSDGRVYWDVDDEMIYEGIRAELDDFDTFTGCIVDLLPNA